MKVIDGREQIALRVEDWFRRRLEAEPLTVADSPTGEEWEKALLNLK